MARLLDYDPLKKVRELFHADGRGFTHERVQDVEQIVKSNRARYNEYTSITPWGDGDHVARIPDVIWAELQKEGIVGRGFKVLDKKRFHKWLNDPDNRAWRVRPGEV